MRPTKPFGYDVTNALALASFAGNTGLKRLIFNEELIKVKIY
jgi:hypothetical protein